jgi:N-acetylneuraminic acid mutarotase
VTHPLFAAILLLAGAMNQSPVGGFWTTAPNLRIPVTAHRATLLRDGRILVTGGYTSIYGFPAAEAQIYDPVSQTWSRVAGMHAARTGDTATLLSDGTVLVVGGLGAKLKALASAEIYYPSKNTWALTPPMPSTRFSHSASLLPDGRVLVAGGIVNGRISRTTLIYDPATNRWDPGPRTHFLHAGQASATLENRDVLIAGAYGGGPEMYDPASARWTVVGATPLRVAPVIASLADGTVLLASGEGVHDHDLRSARLFDPSRDRWIVTGAMHTPRNGALAASLPDGRVLVAGGEQVTINVLRSAELYDPLAHQWTAAAPMSVPRGGATGTPLTDGTILVCGGADFQGVQISCEIYHP